jgi:hypothetical protein
MRIAKRITGIGLLLGFMALSLTIAGCGTAAVSPAYLAHGPNAVNFVQCVANGNSLTGSLSFVLLPSGAKTVQTFNIPFTGTRSGSQLSLTLHGGNGLTTNETTIGGMNTDGLTVTGDIAGSDMTLNLPAANGTLQTVTLVPATIERYNSAVAVLQQQAAQASAAAQATPQPTASTTTSSSPAPTTADLSGTYTDLVARANGLYDQGAALMTNGIPTQQSAQYFVIAAQVYAAAWKKQSTSLDVGTDYSTALFYAGSVDGALKQIEVVLTKSPTFQPALYNKGLFLWHKAQMSTGATKTQLTAQAKQVLQAAIKLSPNSTVGKNAAQVLSNIK